MSRTAWKRREREAAKIIGGRRYPANQGGDVDVESSGYVCQVKERQTLPLAALEALASISRWKSGAWPVARAMP